MLGLSWQEVVEMALKAGGTFLYDLSTQTSCCLGYHFVLSLTISFLFYSEMCFFPLLLLLFLSLIRDLQFII